MGLRDFLQRRITVTRRDTRETGDVTQQPSTNQYVATCDTCDMAKRHGTNRDAGNDAPEWNPADVAEATEERTATVAATRDASAEDVARASKRGCARVFGPGAGNRLPRGSLRVLLR